MRKILLLSVCSLLIAVGMKAQTKAMRASMNENGVITYEPVIIPENFKKASRDADHLSGFPFGREANTVFKTTRGATLVDLDGDGSDEIIFGTDNMIYALDSDGSVIWEREVEGICILPPTVDDMDGDGEWDIAVNNAALGALGAAGRLYLLNADGSDKPGWPANFDDHWMINAPVMADVNGDGVMEIIAGERVSGSQGFLHVLGLNGTELEGWPVETYSNIAFTPSVGDINGDGSQNVIAGLSINGALYAFTADGDTLEGFPQIPDDASLSYQSPLLADITGDGNLEIIGSRHGTNAEYFAIDATGAYVNGWPVASNGWTYSPPSMADIDGDGAYEIFMGNPNTDGSASPQPLDVLFGFDTDGNNLPDFPISKLGGNEGVITLADIDDNGVVDIVFTSNLLTTEDGRGYLHAYASDGSGELDGFPIRTPGLTYLNSAILGDIDADGSLDLTTTSSSTTFGQGTDSVWVSAFDLELPYIPENIYFNAYKGSNGRTGLMQDLLVGIGERELKTLSVYPNPSNGQIFVELPDHLSDGVMTMYDAQGKQMLQRNLRSEYGKIMELDTSTLSGGIYFLQIPLEKTTYMAKVLIE